MMKKYVIDACALIDAAKNYNMSKKTFSNIWETLDKLVEDGRLISSTEILDELKDDDIEKWGKQHKEAFLPLSREIQEKATEILEQYPNMIKIATKGNSNGDPFLIATAIVEGGVIVTNEKKNENKIPYVCEKMGIEYTDLNGFLDEILE